MAVTLPIAVVSGRTARCSTCRLPCQGTLRGPGEWVPLLDDEDGDAGGYRYREGPRLCPTCSARVWRRYLDALRDRRALIRLSWVRPGARMDDVRRLRRLGDAALQAPLFPEIRP